MYVRTVSIGLFLFLTRSLNAMAGVRWHYCKWGLGPRGLWATKCLCFAWRQLWFSSGTSVTKRGIGNVVPHPADPRPRCQSLLTLRALVALLTRGCSWCIRPRAWEGIFPPRDALLLFWMWRVKGDAGKDVKFARSLLTFCFLCRHLSKNGWLSL